MRKLYNNSILQYALIVCLSIVLLLGQTVQLHMHVQHDDISAVEHVVDVHVSSSQHQTTYDSHHQNDFPDHHNYADIDISSDGFLKISKVFSSFVFLLFVISLALFVPLLQRVQKKQVANTKQSTKYYLLHPPLRAPPI